MTAGSIELERHARDVAGLLGSGYPPPPCTNAADHGKLKQLTWPAFKTLKTAYATIKDFEVMRALRKGQASAFVTRDVRGEARIVERAFGLGASALGEAAHFLNERLQLEAA